MRESAGAKPFLKFRKDAMIPQTIIDKITAERTYQDEKWGKQRHAWPLWSTILTEECGEVAEASLNTHFVPTPEHLKELRGELVQVAAVAIEILEHVEEEIAHIRSITDNIEPISANH